MVQCERDRLLHPTWVRGECSISSRAFRPTGGQNSLSSRKKKNMTFHLWQRGEPTESSIGGIRQPTAQAPEIPVEDIELFLTPLLACGEGGKRLGYGGGYYDQVFSNSKGYRLGLGYDFQRANGWENEPQDYPLHAFLSESGLVFFR